MQGKNSTKQRKHKKTKSTFKIICRCSCSILWGHLQCPWEGRMSFSRPACTSWPCPNLAEENRAICSPLQQPTRCSGIAEGTPCVADCSAARKTKVLLPFRQQTTCRLKVSFHNPLAGVYSAAKCDHPKLTEKGHKFGWYQLKGRNSGVT